VEYKITGFKRRTRCAPCAEGLAAESTKETKGLKSFWFDQAEGGGHACDYGGLVADGLDAFFPQRVCGDQIGIVQAWATAYAT